LLSPLLWYIYSLGQVATANAVGINSFFTAHVLGRLDACLGEVGRVALHVELCFNRVQRVRLVQKVESSSSFATWKKSRSLKILISGLTRLGYLNFSLRRRRLGVRQSRVARLLAIGLDQSGCWLPRVALVSPVEE